MPEIEELQFQIYHLKKENSNLKNENQLQKVKVRKLTEELNKVNKQLDVILDPKKNNNITKILSRHGAHLITKLKEENLSLYKKLAEKDLQIKKLQSDLETTRLYVQEKARIVSPSLKLLEHQEIVHKISGKEEYVKEPLVVKFKTRSRSRNHEKYTKSRSRSLSLNKKDSTTTNLEKSYMELLSNNLQKIKQSGSFLQDKMNQDVSPTISKCDSPHEEIQQLQGYLLNVLNEVDSLKNTICELQREQVKTSDILNDKNFYKSLQMKAQQPRSHTDILEDLEDETELSDVRSADKVSSKSSGTSAESDENESTSEHKVTPVESQDIDPVTFGLKSVSIQTTRSFCSRMFTPVTKRESENSGRSYGKVDLDDCDLEAEYI